MIKCRGVGNVPKTLADQERFQGIQTLNLSRACQHQVGNSPLKPLIHHDNMIQKGLRWALNGAPLMPRGSSFSEGFVPNCSGISGRFGLIPYSPLGEIKLNFILKQLKPVLNLMLNQLKPVLNLILKQFIPVLNLILKQFKPALNLILNLIKANQTWLKPYIKTN